MIPQLRLLFAFVRTRWLAGRLNSRARIAAYQARRLMAWYEHARHNIPYYRNHGKNDFFAEPLLDKSRLMQSFGDFNAAAVTAADGWDMFEGRAPQKPGLFVGASTGTSGNRGLYVISDAERHEWLGVMLGKLLPRFPFEPARVALILPLNSALYDAAKGGGLELRFFDLHRGIEALLPEIARFAPDTVIAPPKVLRALAGMAEPPPLKRLFSGAEMLDPLDRAAIEARFNIKVREIYMATEGLLGVACEHGTLHLCEDVVFFEWEHPVAGSDLVAPVITDFTRRTQAMGRYRMNDLLRLSSAPCPCGSAFQAVAALEGRCDDLIDLPDAAGTRHMVTPDVLRNAIVDADRRILDFRLRQTGSHDLELDLPEDAPPDAAEAAQRSLQALIGKMGLRATISLRQRPLDTSARKLRRVENVWKA